VSVDEFRKQGILPEALMNYLGLLGSSFTEGREILSREDMITAFSLERASKSGAIFDEEKLHWLNAIYIRNCATGDLVERLKPFFEQAGYETATLDPMWLNGVVDLIKSDLTTLSAIGCHIDIFFDDKYEITTEAGQLLAKESARQVVKTFAEYLQTSAETVQEIYPVAIKYIKEKVGVKGKDLFMPIRAALTGRLHGPELDSVFAILGKESALKRINKLTSLI
jgi:nondiscriminating glutamyl-tRNA synthetase